ncbi:HyaD/HybD family hydrogenase maturation endopeptidase|uniref:Hydrogenase maturation protease n=1 Tax=Dendrosporobacter quercicolus TaxID=146817 RepID=A0A1G9MP01_9FIRM|nr:HyaD/HybD family hydrogenase maturation endopeptidase [Dendrosporobacter quercicolus]NSL47088.1 HyaD/HybD family hydrogenase maturation endopeptidase [Dendrosporobacter quercicolus DSM 1736]SDL75637.1 hydrogenase maturation protease [Dendrosporobacter quercicolus]
MPEITVLGVGNILLQDEGFGVRVIEELGKTYNFAQNVEVLDGGTLGLGLLPYLKGTDKLIIVDAVAGTLAPGEFYQFTANEIAAYFGSSLSLHELGLQEVLAALEMLEKPVKDMVIFGIQPACVAPGLELSPLISGKVGPAMEKVLEQLRVWQVEIALAESISFAGGCWKGRRS